MTDAITVWSPLGRAGTSPVVDELNGHIDVTPGTKPPPVRHRCDVDVLDTRLRFTLRGDAEQSAATLNDPRSERWCRSLEAEAENGLSAGAVVWGYVRIPLEVFGERLDIERVPEGRGWLWEVTSATRGTWTWRPEGRLFADRMVLRRQGEELPRVTYLVRPVPGRRARAGEQSSVSWAPEASLAEVAACIVWILRGHWTGALPKVQKVKTFDFL